MKKNSIWFYAFLLIGLIGFTSCGDDTEDPGTNGNVTAAFTVSQSTYTVGDRFDITASVSADAGIQSIQLERKAPGETDFTSLSLKTSGFDSNTSDAFVYDWNTAGSLAGEYSFRVTVRDASSKTATDEIMITLSVPAIELTEISLGSFDSNIGSFFEIDQQANGVRNIAFMQANATNYQLIDFAYSFGSSESNQASIFSLDDALAGSFFGNDAPSWTAPKETRFKLASDTEYQLSTDVELKSAYDASSSTADSRATLLAVNDVVLIKQAGSEKVFALKVTAVTDGNAGSISFTMKGVW